LGGTFARKGHLELLNEDKNNFHRHFCRGFMQNQKCEQKRKSANASSLHKSANSSLFCKKPDNLLKISVFFIEKKIRTKTSGTNKKKTWKQARLTQFSSLF